MAKEHIAERQLRYLRDYLSQDCPIGFLVSAGCTLSVDMPDEDWPLIPDIKGLTDYVLSQHSDNVKFQALVNELESNDITKPHIETILTYIRELKAVAKGTSVKDLTESELSELEMSVCRCIAEKVCVELPFAQTPYDNLANWVRAINRKKPIEIFTTNYDLLMEEAFDRIEIPYFDGFVGSRNALFDLNAVENDLIPSHWVRLWKIHGSINWQYDARNRVVRCSNVDTDKALLIFPSHLKYLESKKMPYVALFDRLSKFIKQQSAILITCGYSFNDEHINDTIKNALITNQSSIVISLLYGSFFNDDGNEQYPKAYELASKLPNMTIITDDRAIIGTAVGEWVKDRIDSDKDDNINKHIISHNEEGNSNKITIQLGDFKAFSDFLVELIDPVRAR